jgi:hypothetical protein
MFVSAKFEDDDGFTDMTANERASYSALVLPGMVVCGLLWATAVALLAILLCRPAPDGRPDISV